MSNHSGVGTALSAAEVQAQRIEDARAAAADAEALAHDREVAAAEAARTVAIWEDRIRRHVEALLIDLAERKHHDANRQQWYDSLRASLADAKAGLWE
jgi:hypothetical protein